MLIILIIFKLFLKREYEEKEVFNSLLTILFRSVRKRLSRFAPASVPDVALNRPIRPYRKSGYFSGQAHKVVRSEYFSRNKLGVKKDVADSDKTKDIYVLGETYLGVCSV